MQRSKIAWKMWRFWGTNVFVVANNKTEAKKLFRSYMYDAMDYKQSFDWGYSDLEGQDTNDWYEYIVQGPNVWFQPDPGSIQLEPIPRITEREAIRILTTQGHELKTAPLEVVLKRVLEAERVTGASSEGVPYYIRRDAVLYGDHNGHCTICYRLCYSQITPELSAYQIGPT